MKKTRIHGEIKDKFIIRSIKLDKLVQENMSNEREWAPWNFPAIFNTKEDAERYINERDADKSEELNLVIESTKISFFDQGGILVEFED